MNFTNYKSAQKPLILKANDNIYTRYEDIDWIMSKVDVSIFNNKVIYMPCDTPNSNFWRYFCDNFEKLHLKEIICSHKLSANEKRCYVTSFSGKTIEETYVNCNGDFRSKELQVYWGRADFIITNPPQELLEEFYDMIDDRNLSYLFIADSLNIFTAAIALNAISLYIYNYTNYSEVGLFEDKFGKYVKKRVYWLSNFKLPLY
jgi:hypothetical protein